MKSFNYAAEYNAPLHDAQQRRPSTFMYRANTTNTTGVPNAIVRGRQLSAIMTEPLEVPAGEGVWGHNRRPTTAGSECTTSVFDLRPDDTSMPSQKQHEQRQQRPSFSLGAAPSPSTRLAVVPPESPRERAMKRSTQTPSVAGVLADGDLLMAKGMPTNPYESSLAATAEDSVGGDVRRYPPSLGNMHVGRDLQSGATIRALNFEHQRALQQQQQPNRSSTNFFHGIPVNHKMAPYAGQRMALSPRRAAGQSVAVGGSGHQRPMGGRPLHEALPAAASSPSVTYADAYAIQQVQRVDDAADAFVIPSVSGDDPSRAVVSPRQARTAGMNNNTNFPDSSSSMAASFSVALHEPPSQSSHGPRAVEARAKSPVMVGVVAGGGADGNNATTFPRDRAVQFADPASMMGGHPMRFSAASSSAVHSGYHRDTTHLQQQQPPPNPIRQSALMGVNDASFHHMSQQQQQQFLATGALLPNSSMGRVQSLGMVSEPATMNIALRGVNEDNDMQASKGMDRVGEPTYQARAPSPATNQSHPVRDESPSRYVPRQHTSTYATSPARTGVLLGTAAAAPPLRMVPITVTDDAPNAHMVKASNTPILQVAPPPKTTTTMAAPLTGGSAPYGMDQSPAPQRFNSHSTNPPVDSTTGQLLPDANVYTAAILPPRLTQTEVDAILAKEHYTMQIQRDRYNNAIQEAIAAAVEASRKTSAIQPKREEVDEEDGVAGSSQPPAQRVDTLPPSGRQHLAHREADTGLNQWRGGPLTPTAHPATSQRQAVTTQQPTPPSTALLLSSSRIHLGDQTSLEDLRKAVISTAHEVLRAEIKLLVQLREDGGTTDVPATSPARLLISNSANNKIGGTPMAAIAYNGQGALLDEGTADSFFRAIEGATGGGLVNLGPAGASPITRMAVMGSEGPHAAELTTPDARHAFVMRQLGPVAESKQLTPASAVNGSTPGSPLEAYASQFDPTSGRIIMGPSSSGVGGVVGRADGAAAVQRDTYMNTAAGKQHDSADAALFHLNMLRYLGDTHEGVRAGASFDMATCAKIIAAVAERFVEAHPPMTTRLPLTAALHGEICTLVRQEMLHASVTYGKLLEEPNYFGQYASADSPFPMTGTQYTPIALSSAVIEAKRQAAERAEKLKAMDAIPPEPHSVWVPGESYKKYPKPAEGVQQFTKPITVDNGAGGAGGDREDLRTAPNQQYQHPAAVAIAADLSLNKAVVVLGDVTFKHVSVGGEEGTAAVIVASVNREIDGSTAPPLWTMALGSRFAAAGSIIAVDSLKHLGRASTSQVLRTAEQSVFVLELLPGAVRSGQQYTVWFRPTPSSTAVECRSFWMP